MKRPSPAASIKYSGQCPRSALPMLFPALLQELGHEAGPAGLVTRADAGAVVAMEVFVEEDQVPPVRIGLEHLEAAVHRAPAVRTDEEDAGEAPRQVGRHVPEGHRLPGARGHLDLQLAAEEVVEALQRLDDEEVHREPDGPPPVRVAAEEPGGRLR